MSNSYDYAILRIVPSVERGECINAGIILYCSTRRFLGVRTYLDRQRLHVLAPSLDISAVEQQVFHLVEICSGTAQSGPVGQLSQSERFHWLVSPRSTIIQTSPVHSGMCDDPEAALQSLLKKLVL